MLTLAAACALSAAHGHGHHGQPAHDDHDHHDHDDHDHAHIVELSAASWDKVIDNDPHVWAVKFYSKLCSSCQAFKPAYEAVSQQVEGLHWAGLNIDEKENIALAKKFGVLNEGIPNVKLLNAADSPLPIVTGETPEASEVVAKLKETLQSAGATKDEAGYYKSHGRSEL